MTMHEKISDRTLLGALPESDKKPLIGAITQAYEEGLYSDLEVITAMVHFIDNPEQAFAQMTEGNSQGSYLEAFEELEHILAHATTEDAKALHWEGVRRSTQEMFTPTAINKMEPQTDQMPEPEEINAAFKIWSCIYAATIPSKQQNYEQASQLIEESLTTPEAATHFVTTTKGAWTSVIGIEDQYQDLLFEVVIGAIEQAKKPSASSFMRKARPLARLLQTSQLDNTKLQRFLEVINSQNAVINEELDWRAAEQVYRQHPQYFGVATDTA